MERLASLASVCPPSLGLTSSAAATRALPAQAPPLTLPATAQAALPGEPSSANQMRPVQPVPAAGLLLLTVKQESNNHGSHSHSTFSGPGRAPSAGSLVHWPFTTALSGEHCLPLIVRARVWACPRAHRTGPKCQPWPRRALTR